MGSETPKLTKADTVALWHAVQWMDICVRQGGKDEQGIAVERERLAAAKRALRKVNAIRKAASQAHGAADEAHNGGEPSAAEEKAAP